MAPTKVESLCCHCKLFKQVIMYYIKNNFNTFISTFININLLIQLLLLFLVHFKYKDIKSKYKKFGLIFSFTDDSQVIHFAIKNKNKQQIITNCTTVNKALNFLVKLINCFKSNSY